MKQKILVTGGAGFQGSHIIEHLLAEGHDVTILNTSSERSEKNLSRFQKSPRVVFGSVTDKEVVEKTVREHDVIMHLAARVNVDESIKYPFAFIETNIHGTYNILEAIRKNGGNQRLIYASTSEVYGSHPEKESLGEEIELRPHSPYAASKAAADRMCFAYYKTYGLPITIVRPFNIYGERQKDGVGGAMIPIFVKKALNNEPITIFGDGSQTRDYMHVSDLVQGYDIVLKNDALNGQVINFGSGKETSIKDIALYIAKKLNAQIEHKEQRPGEVARFPIANITKASSFGFKPKVDIWDGLERYISWRKNQN